MIQNKMKKAGFGLIKYIKNEKFEWGQTEKRK